MRIMGDFMPPPQVQHPECGPGESLRDALSRVVGERDAARHDVERLEAMELRARAVEARKVPFIPSSDGPPDLASDTARFILHGRKRSA